MEKVGIVDENLKVLYATTKQEAHVRGLLHVAVIAEVINSKGEWLLVKQASHKQDPGQFVSPVGGHVSSGESYEEALMREGYEEIGIKKIEYEFVGRAIYHRKRDAGTENHYFVVYKINSDKDPVLNDESVEFKWFAPTEIRQLLKTNPGTFGQAFHFVATKFFSDLFQ